MKKLFLLISLSAITLLSVAQGKFKFEEESYDFGTVIEGEKATHVFKFTNTGDAPITISSVRASCGCTTPEWPKEPVAPGESGEIKAIYNSKGRLNAFNKSIRVSSNAMEQSKTLYIKGTVVKEPPRVYTAEEKAKSPIITIDRLEYNFGKVQQGEKISKNILVKNTGKSPLKIEKVESSCYCVAIQKAPEEIAPGEEEQLTISYAPRGQNERIDKVIVKSNDITKDNVTLTFKSNVVESIAAGSVFQKSNPFK